MLSRIRIVLVETTHPGNIGAVARAMKNLGLNQLALVSPQSFPNAQATARAAGADDILCAANVYATLTEAIRDCHLIIGATARSRTIAWPELEPRECARKIFNEPEGTNVALLFGRESSGLTNDELDRCHYILRIPANPQFPSMNVASAVLVIAYELLLASRNSERKNQDTVVPATADQLESYFTHLDQTLCQIGFIHPDRSRSIMRRLRRLFNRTRLEEKEVDILRGILSAAQGKKSQKHENR